ATSFERSRNKLDAVDRSVRTDARAEPAPPESGTASGALGHHRDRAPPSDRLHAPRRPRRRLDAPSLLGREPRADAMGDAGRGDLRRARPEPLVERAATHPRPTVRAAEPRLSRA